MIDKSIARAAATAVRLSLHENAHSSPTAARPIAGQAECAEPRRPVEVCVVEGEKRKEEEDGRRDEQRRLQDAAGVGPLAAASVHGAGLVGALLSVLIMRVRARLFVEGLVRRDGWRGDRERLGSDGDHVYKRDV